jgi:hypothetical protein
MSCRRDYYTHMRRGRELSKTIVVGVLFLCALVLAAALTGAAGMIAVVSVLVSPLIFIFLAVFPRGTGARAVLRVRRGRPTRAPPLF